MAMRTIWGAALALALMLAAAPSPARADDATRLPRATPAAPAATDISAQRRRPPTRLRVTPRGRYLPPTAQRACEAWYAPEYRPSGTVIVPRMRCRWVNG
jgi:hypothetical protein